MLHHEQARDWTRRLPNLGAQELDPLTFFFGDDVAWPLHYGGRYEEAVKQREGMLDMNPKDARLIAYVHQIRAESFLERGLYKQALEQFLQSDSASGAGPETIVALRTSYETSGKATGREA